MNDRAANDPKVSVVCAWFNRADFLSDTLDSLLAQDFDDYDVTLVNDGSPDPRVREILDSYSDPRLRVIHQENTGFVGAIRRAIDESRGEYVAVMGAGDVSMPSRLRVQAAALDADPACVGVGSSFRNVTIDEKGETVHVAEHNRRPVPITHDFILGGRTARSPFTHGEVTYRRSIYEAVGGYRAFFRFSQDIDLWLRMTRHGHFSICPEMLYERRIFMSDGIQADIRKFVVQINFARLAQRFARDYDRRGFDLIDMFGPQAGMMAYPDAFMSRALGKTALKYLRNGLPGEAEFFADLSGRGESTAISLLARLLVGLHARPATRSLARLVASKLPFTDTRETYPIKIISGR